MGVPRIIGFIFSMLKAIEATPEEIERLREKRLRRLLRTAVAKSPFYRNLYRGIDIETCRLTDLPVVDKHTMMANFDDFVTDRRLKRTPINHWLEDKNNLGKKYMGKYIAFQTSGTTGENALVIYDRRALDFAHAALLARHSELKKMTIPEAVRIILKTLFVRRFRITAILMAGGPYPSYTIAIHPPPLYQLFVKEEIHSLFEPISELVANLNASSCNHLYSYPSILDKLAREQLAGRLKLKLEKPLSAIISGSEPLTEATKRLVEKAWGMKVQDHYGSSECVLMARSCGNFERMHVMSDLCFLEIVDRQGRPVPDGQRGDKVLLTNLCNLTQPFIRYEINDVTGYSTQICSCGQPFPTLLPVDGRTDDIFYIDRSGGGYEELHPYLFLGPIMELTEIREYQLVQTGRNEFTLSYVPVNSGAEIENKVRNVIEEGMRKAGFLDRVTLKLLCVKNIPRDPRSGKMRQLISRVGAPADLDDDRGNN
ncbi:MAG: AMP-binding protein [Smithella sp.]|jgi:phenylacetate-coenzyme A ligase PaaK-like adenylate-forming protein